MPEFMGKERIDLALRQLVHGRLRHANNGAAVLVGNGKAVDVLCGKDADAGGGLEADGRAHRDHALLQGRCSGSPHVEVHLGPTRREAPFMLISPMIHPPNTAMIAATGMAPNQKAARMGLPTIMESVIMTKQNTRVPITGADAKADGRASSGGVKAGGHEARISGKNRAVTKPEP